MRGSKRKTPHRAAPLGRILAILRTSLDLTQLDLAKRSGVKRASISLYERGLSTPDASTLERLLGAMQFGWSALDFGGWFLTRLSADCRIAEEAGIEGSAPTPLATAATLGSRLSANVHSICCTAETLRQLVSRLHGEEKGDASPEGPKSPAALGPDQDREAARALWNSLKPLSRGDQLAALPSAPAGSHWALCELLCVESQRLCGEDPSKAGAFCELALAAAELAVGDDAWRANLKGLAFAHLGNVLRARGDLQAAERAFDSADEFSERGGSGENGLLEEGLIPALKASLRRAQRRFDEAAVLLDQASCLAASAAFRIQVLVSKAKLLEEVGQLEEAAAILFGVKDAAPVDLEPKLLFHIWHNLADTLSKLGRFEEAATFLPEARRHCRQGGGELNRIRLSWTEARIVAGRGAAEEGMALLSRVRGEFAAREMAYDAALVSLELAVFYAEEGRLDQVKTLARHMAPIFQAQEVHREAVAALTLFRQAAERERVTGEFARDVLLYLRLARHNPELRFVECA